MAPLLSGFAGQYNRRHKRSGYVFQNRYKSILCDANSYLLELVRYIHLNPLRAGLIENLEKLGRYPWTSHAGLLCKHRQDWHSLDEVLSLFGSDRRQARNRYLIFMAVTVDNTSTQRLSSGGLIRSYGGWETIVRLRKEHIRCIGDERILGDSRFVELVLKKDSLFLETSTRITRQGWCLEKLIEQVCKVCELRKLDILGKARANNLSTAKSLICYFGTQKLELTAREIATRLKISQPAVSGWVRKGSNYSGEAKTTLEELIG